MLQAMCVSAQADEPRSDDTQQIQAANLQGPQDELMNLMTIMYMCIQETLSDPFGLPSVRSELCMLSIITLSGPVTY